MRINHVTDERYNVDRCDSTVQNLFCKDCLAKIYYDPCGSFLGPEKLYQYVLKAGKYVLSKYKIRKWLQRAES